MLSDKELFNLIEKEKQRQCDGIELIASENYVSSEVEKALGSCLTNKYAEGYPGHRYYGGCEIVDQVEELAQNRLKELYGACYANVQPHSGSQANMAVFNACLKPGDKFIGLNLSHGGHLTHGSPVNFSGTLYTALEYNVGENGLIDYDKFEETCFKERPKLIIGGASAYSRDWDYIRMRKVADEIGAIFMVDMAHPAGLIAANLLNNPVKHAHIVTSTTHKTLRGPRGGIILMGEDFENPFGKTDNKGNLKMMSQLLNSAIFPGIQGGPLEHVIAAKAVSFYEAMQPEFAIYQHNVINNAKALANYLMRYGYKIVSGGTDNHCMLIDLRTKFHDMTGKEAEQILGKCNITVNKNMIPYDTRSPFQTSGIRLGTPAITTRGITSASDIAQIATFIDTALTYKDVPDMLNRIKENVSDMMHYKPLFKWD